MEETKSENQKGATGSVHVLTFTYPNDAVRAGRNLQLLPKEWRKTWIVESKHAEMPVPDGVELCVRDFPRGGTLRDASAVFAMARIYAEDLQSDVVIKLDSDCALFSPETWARPIIEDGADFVFIRRSYSEGREFCNGCCYSLSIEARKRIRARFYPRGIPATFRGHEDLIFSHFLNSIEVDLYGVPVNKERVYLCVRPYYGADCLAGHFGYLTREKELEETNKILRGMGRPELDTMEEYAGKIDEFLAKNPELAKAPERRAV